MHNLRTRHLHLSCMPCTNMNIRDISYDWVKSLHGTRKSMTKFSQELLDEKIALCAKALADLQRYQETGSLTYLRAHPDMYYAVCYRFVGVIEALFDAA